MPGGGMPDFGAEDDEDDEGDDDEAAPADKGKAKESSVSCDEHLTVPL